MWIDIHAETEKKGVKNDYCRSPSVSASTTALSIPHSSSAELTPSWYPTSAYLLSMAQWQKPHAKSIFSINVWAGIIVMRFGPAMMPNRLGDEEYLEFLQETLSQLPENMSLNTKSKLWFMHDGAPPIYTMTVRQYLSWSLDRSGWRRSSMFAFWVSGPQPFRFFLLELFKGKWICYNSNHRWGIWQRIVRGSNKIRQGGYFWHVQRALSDSCINNLHWVQIDLEFTEHIWCMHFVLNFSLVLN